MELGIIGLGRMGGNLAERLLGAGHNLVVYDTNGEAIQAVLKRGARAATDLNDLIKKLRQPRAVWVMVPAGDPTETTINTLSRLLSADDIIIDGGNSCYKDGVRRAAAVKSRGIHFLDCGTSGGIWGGKEGYCLMVGGEKSAFQRIEPILQTLAPSPEHGYAHMGPSGAGHFVKMIHNGIEYGMMEAIAEGFELLKAKKEFSLDLAAIAETWRYGSVVRSWLLDLGAAALKADPELAGVKSYVDDTGEGRWTAQEGIELAVPLPVITLALLARFRSRQEGPFAGKLLAALRNQFGGHALHPDEKGQ